jgi:hypothetical protein
MIFCPKNAEMFGEHQAKHETLADWCRRVYQAGSDRCQRCDMRKQLGVVVESSVKKKEGEKPVQGRLF